MRGVYWTIPDEKGKEVKRDIPIEEENILKYYQNLKKLILTKFMMF